MIEHRGAVERIQHGVMRGLRAGAIFGGISLVINLVTRGAPYAQFGVGPISMSAAYVCGGAFGGALVGLIRPFATSAVKAALVGTVAFLPFAVLVRCARNGFLNWGLSEVVGLLVVSSMLGCLWGPSVWRASLKEGSDA